MEVVDHVIDKIIALSNAVTTASNIDTPSDSVDAHSSCTVLEAAHPMPETASRPEDVPSLETVSALGGASTVPVVTAASTEAAVTVPDMTICTARGNDLTLPNTSLTKMEDAQLANTEEDIKSSAKVVETVAHSTTVKRIQATKLGEELQSVNIKEQLLQPEKTDGVNIAKVVPTTIISPSIPGERSPASMTAVTAETNGGSVSLRSNNKIGKQRSSGSLSTPNITVTALKDEAWKHGHEPPVTPHPPQKNKDTHYPYRPPRVDEKLYQVEIPPLYRPVKVRSSERSLRKDSSGGSQRQRAPILHQKDRDTPEIGCGAVEAAVVGPPLELHSPRSDDQLGSGKQLPTMLSDSLRPGQVHLDEYQVWNPALAGKDLDIFLSYCRRLAVQSEDGGVGPVLIGRGGGYVVDHRPDEDGEGDTSTDLKASKPLESDEMQLNWLKLHEGDVETACLHSAALVGCGTAQRSLDVEDHYIGNPRLQMGSWQARRLRRFAPLGGYTCTSDGLQSYGMVSHREDPTAPLHNSMTNTTTTTTTPPTVSLGSEGGGESQMNTDSTNIKTVENGISQEKMVDGTSPDNSVLPAVSSPEKQQQEVIANAGSSTPESTTPTPPPQSLPTRSRHSSSELGRRGADRAEYKARWRNILRTAEEYVLYANNQPSLKPSLQACVDVLNDASSLPLPEQSPGEDFVSQVSAALAELSTLVNHTRIWTSRVLDALSSKKAAGDSESEDDEKGDINGLGNSSTVCCGWLRREKSPYLFPQKGRLSIPEAKKLLLEGKALALDTKEEKLLQKVITQAEAWEAKAEQSIMACDKAGSSERGWKTNNSKNINWASYIVSLIEEAVGIPLRLKNESILTKRLLKADAIATKLISLVPPCHTNGCVQKKCPLNEVIAVSVELDQTGLKYPSTSFAREHICAARKWKKEAQSALDGTVALKVLQSLVSESSSLPFDVFEISAPLVAKLDRALEWLNRVKKAVPKKQRTTHTRGYPAAHGDNCMTSGGARTIEEDKRVNLNEARILLEEREEHGVEVEAKEVACMSSLVDTAEEWMGRVREMLEVGEETDLQALNDILLEADNIPVTMDEQQVLKVGIKVRQWKLKVAEAIRDDDVNKDTAEQQQHHPQGREEEEENGGREDGMTTSSTTERKKKFISFAYLRSLSQEASVLRAMLPASARSSPIYGLLENKKMQSLLQKAESWVARTGRLSADLLAGRLVTSVRCTELIAEADLLPLDIHEMDSWRVIKDAVAELVPWMEKASDVLNGCGIKADKTNKNAASPPPQLTSSYSGGNEGVMAAAMVVDKEPFYSETQRHQGGNDGSIQDSHYSAVPEDRMEVEENNKPHTIRKIPFSEAQKWYTEAEQLQYGKSLREVRDLRKILLKYNEWKAMVDKLCPLTQDVSMASQHIGPQNSGGGIPPNGGGSSELQKEPLQMEVSQYPPTSGTGNGGSGPGRRRRRQKPEGEGGDEDVKYSNPKLQQFVDACNTGDELPIDVTKPLEQLRKRLDSAKKWQNKARETILNILRNFTTDTLMRKELKSVTVSSPNSNSNSNTEAIPVLLPQTVSVSQPKLESDRQSPQGSAAIAVSSEDVIIPPAVLPPVSEVVSEVSATSHTTAPLSANAPPPPTFVGDDGAVSTSSNNESKEIPQSIGSTGVKNVCEEDLDEKEDQYIDDLKHLVEEAKLVCVVMAEEKFCGQLLDAIVWSQDVRRLCVPGSCFTGSKRPTVKEARDIAKAGEKSGTVVTTLSELEWKEEDINHGRLYLETFLKTYQDDAAPLADRLQASSEWAERARKVMESSDASPAELRELLKQTTGMGFSNVELKKKIKLEVQKNNVWFQKAKAAISGAACLTLSGTKKLVAEGEKVRGAADLVRQLKLEMKSAGKWLALVKKTGLQQGTATMAEIKALIPQASNICVDLSSELKVLHLATSVHCICRRGATASSCMISCSCCHEQFHGHCLGIKKENDTANPAVLEKYVCITCRIVKLYRESEEIIMGAFNRWVPYARQMGNSTGAAATDGKFSELGRENFNALVTVMKDALQLPHENIRFNVQVFDEVASNISALDHLMWPPGPIGNQQYNEAKLVLQSLRTVLWATMAQWVFRGRPYVFTVEMLVKQASRLSIVDGELLSSLESMTKRCLEWCSEARQLLQPPSPTQRDRPIELSRLKKLSTSVQLLPFIMKEEHMIETVLEDEGMRYCICRAPNDGGFMIGCDCCEVWYHGRCCNFSQSNSPSEFICESCCDKDEKEYPFPPMKVAPVPEEDEPLDTGPESETIRHFEPLWPSRAVLSLLGTALFMNDSGERVPFSHNDNSFSTPQSNMAHTKVEQSSSSSFSPFQSQSQSQQQNLHSAESNLQKDLGKAASPVPAPPQEGKSASSSPSLRQGGLQCSSVPHYQLDGGSAGYSSFPTSGPQLVQQGKEKDLSAVQPPNVLQQPSAGHPHPSSSMEAGLMAGGISYPSAGVCTPPQQWSAEVAMAGSCQFVHPPNSYEFVNSNSWYSHTAHGYGENNIQQNPIHPGDFGTGSKNAPVVTHINLQQHQGEMGSTAVTQNTPPTGSKRAHVMSEDDISISATSEGHTHVGVASSLPVGEPLQKRPRDDL